MTLKKQVVSVYDSDQTPLTMVKCNCCGQQSCETHSFRNSLPSLRCWAASVESIVYQFAALISFHLFLGWHHPVGHLHVSGPKGPKDQPESTKQHPQHRRPSLQTEENVRLDPVGYRGPTAGTSTGNFFTKQLASSHRQICEMKRT